MNLCDLPNDILLKIISKSLSARDLANVTLSSKKLAKLDLPEDVWQDVYERHPWSNGRQPLVAGPSRERFVRRIQMERKNFAGTKESIASAQFDIACLGAGRGMDTLVAPQLHFLTQDLHRLEAINTKIRENFERSKLPLEPPRRHEIITRLKRVFDSLLPALLKYCTTCRDSHLDDSSAA